MAQLTISGESVVVHLNPVETLMALRRRVTVPISAVRSVEVEDRPLTRGSALSVKMGFAASAAPLSNLATIGPKSKFRDGRAFVLVWRNSRSVVVELEGNPTQWRLLVVSVKHPDEAAKRLRAVLSE